MVKFDYTITDKLERNTIHVAVWNYNLSIIRKLYRQNHTILTKADKYGIVPIVYGALLGNQDMVLLFKGG